MTELDDRISELMKEREALSRLTMNEIIDRIAEALYTENYRNKRSTKWTTLMESAEAGRESSMVTVAKWRRMARKAHSAWMDAVDEKRDGR